MPTKLRNIPLRVWCAATVLLILVVMVIITDPWVVLSVLLIALLVWSMLTVLNYLLEDR
jgi:phosphatidylserine synthase